MESRPAVGLFVVEWNHFRPIGTANNVDVQLILRDPAVWPTATGNGDILLHLHDITTSNGDNGVTIGLESPDERGGLPYAFNNQWAPAAQPITDGCYLSGGGERPAAGRWSCQPRTAQPASQSIQPGDALAPAGPAHVGAALATGECAGTDPA
jgi:hypothetical protein